MRNYIVTTQELARHVQRRSESFSFFSFVLLLTQRFLNLRDDTMQTLRANADGYEGFHGLLPEMRSVTKNLLRPGPDLDELLGAQMDAFTYTLRKAAGGNGKFTFALALLSFVCFIAIAGLMGAKPV